MANYGLNNFPTLVPSSLTNFPLQLPSRSCESRWKISREDFLTRPKASCDARTRAGASASAQTVIGVSRIYSGKVKTSERNYRNEL